MSSSPDADLVIDALLMGFERRRPDEKVIQPAGLPMNTSVIKVLQRLVEPAQFTSWAFTRGAIDSGMLPSMGSVGDCYDNAMMESFWSRMQVELLDRKRWKTRVELATAMFDCIEVFHNRQRRHSALGMMFLIEFEARRAPKSAA